MDTVTRTAYSDGNPGTGDMFVGFKPGRSSTSLLLACRRLAFRERDGTSNTVVPVEVTPDSFKAALDFAPIVDRLAASGVLSCGFRFLTPAWRLGSHNS
jgi:hypothetical protein